jgi:hypothetical protein
MSGRPSGFKTASARAEYCRLYDEAIGLSTVPVDESDGDLSKPPLAALHGLMLSATKWHDGAKMAERFRQRLPRAQVELVDDTNHAMVIDQPALVEGLLQEFFSP